MDVVLSGTKNENQEYRKVHGEKNTNIFNFFFFIVVVLVLVKGAFFDLHHGGGGRRWRMNCVWNRLNIVNNHETPQTVQN